MKTIQHAIYIAVLVLVLACSKQPSHPVAPLEESDTVTYASGFTIDQKGTYTLLTIKTPYPNSQETFTYALLKKGMRPPENEPVDGVIPIPIEKIVVTSTTHIPSLEMLDVTESLVGFPHTDYISSEKTRALIHAGKVRELGQNESINTEVTLALVPDVVVAFGVDAKSTSLTTVARAGIPVIYNGDWVEQHPLGKAEWIKFFGALYDKQEEANTIFENIEENYLDTKALAAALNHKPTVLSGALYKDVWYLPYGNSWAGQLIKDAGGQYLWADSEGSGSLALSVETVLQKAQAADVWISPGQYASFKSLAKAHPVYQQFAAFQKKQVYNFAAKKGATGGMLYYELAPNRPDLVLKDLVKQLHPVLLTDYEPTFFTRLE